MPTKSPIVGKVKILSTKTPVQEGRKCGVRKGLNLGGPFLKYRGVKSLVVMKEEARINHLGEEGRFGKGTVAREEHLVKSEKREGSDPHHERNQRKKDKSTPFHQRGG